MDRQIQSIFEHMWLINVWYDYLKHYITDNPTAQTDSILDVASSIISRNAGSGKMAIELIYLQLERDPFMSEYNLLDLMDSDVSIIYYQYTIIVIIRRGSLLAEQLPVFIFPSISELLICTFGQSTHTTIFIWLLSRSNWRCWPYQDLPTTTYYYYTIISISRQASLYYTYN